MSSVRNLGAYFDERMSMVEHVNRLVRPCFYQLRRVQFIRRSLTTMTATRLMNSFIIARVDYCNSVLAGLSKQQLARIQSVLNVAARIIFGHARFDHITPTLRTRLHWLKVPQLMEFKRCLLVYKALHWQAPAYIASFCSEVSSPRRLQSSSHHRLQILPLAKTVKLGERSFAIGGPSAWNNLPDAVKESEILESFKQRLKTLIFNLPQQTYVDMTMLSALDFGLGRAMAL